jgi:hypothetical protein
MTHTALGLSGPPKPERCELPSLETLRWIGAFATVCAMAIAPGISWFWWAAALVFELISMSLGAPPLIGMYVAWPIVLTLFVRLMIWWVPRRRRMSL